MQPLHKFVCLLCSLHLCGCMTAPPMMYITLLYRHISRHTSRSFVCLFFFRKIGKLSQLCFLVNQSTASLTSHNTCKQVMMTRSFPHRNIRLAGHSELSMVPLLCDGLLTFCLQCLNLLQGFGLVTCLLPLLPGQTLAPPNPNQEDGWSDEDWNQLIETNKGLLPNNIVHCKMFIYKIILFCHHSSIGGPPTPTCSGFCVAATLSDQRDSLWLFWGRVDC